MIRLLHCVKRQDDISVEEFRHFWNGAEFNNLIDEMMGLTLTAEVKKNLTLDIPMNTELQMARESKQPFDAVLEIIWQSGHEIEVLANDEHFLELYEKMTELQKKYIDFSESRRFFTEYAEN